VGERLTKNQLQIISLIKKDKNVTTKEMSKAIGIAKKNIENNIKKLKEKGYVERVGAAKGGYWSIINNEK